MSSGTHRRRPPAASAGRRLLLMQLDQLVSNYLNNQGFILNKSQTATERNMKVQSGIKPFVLEILSLTLIMLHLRFLNLLFIDPKSTKLMILSDTILIDNSQAGHMVTLNGTVKSKHPHCNSIWCRNLTRMVTFQSC